MSILIIKDESIPLIKLKIEIDKQNLMSSFDSLRIIDIQRNDCTEEELKGLKARYYCDIKKYNPNARKIY